MFNKKQVHVIILFIAPSWQGPVTDSRLCKSDDPCFLLIVLWPFAAEPSISWPVMPTLTPYVSHSTPMMLSAALIAQTPAWNVKWGKWEIRKLSASQQQLKAVGVLVICSAVCIANTRLAISTRASMKEAWGPSAPLALRALSLLVQGLLLHFLPSCHYFPSFYFCCYAPGHHQKKKLSKNISPTHDDGCQDLLFTFNYSPLCHDCYQQL